jgi:hypothetical protein
MGIADEACSTHCGINDPLQNDGITDSGSGDHRYRRLNQMP